MNEYCEYVIRHSSLIESLPSRSKSKSIQIHLGIAPLKQSSIPKMPGDKYFSKDEILFGRSENPFLILKWSKSFFFTVKTSFLIIPAEAKSPLTSTWASLFLALSHSVQIGVNHERKSFNSSFCPQINIPLELRLLKVVFYGENDLQ
jgi:hypothetical protein